MEWLFSFRKIKKATRKVEKTTFRVASNHYCCPERLIHSCILSFKELNPSESFSSTRV